MKNVILIIGLIFFCGCINNGPRKVSAMETFGFLNNDFAILIDIRTDNEISVMAERSFRFSKADIENNLENWKQFTNSLSKEKEIIFCASDEEQAKKIATIVSKRGNKSAYMTNFQDWIDNNLPIIKH